MQKVFNVVQQIIKSTHLSLGCIWEFQKMLSEDINIYFLISPCILGYFFLDKISKGKLFKGFMTTLSVKV